MLTIISASLISGSDISHYLKLCITLTPSHGCSTLASSAFKVSDFFSIFVEHGVAGIGRPDRLGANLKVGYNPLSARLRSLQ